MSSDFQPSAAPPPSPKVVFRNAATAVRNLERIRKAVPDTVYQALAQALPDLPAPDSVVNQFSRFVEDSSPEVLNQLRQQLSLVHPIALVFAHSPWLGETLIRDPDLIYDWRLYDSYSGETFQERYASFRERSLGKDTAVCLAGFKRREYLRILLRDVLGIATLAETTVEISALSDVLIGLAVAEVYAQLQARYGTPQVASGGELRDAGFAVLSLGKLGGQELNYSSDIDLLFLYEGGEEVDGSAVSHREFFLRLAQQTTELLSRPTSEGPAFRIDLRLRPQGNQGELAVPLPYAMRYYSHTAQDWELQAMIKARHCAGQTGVTRQFLRAVQPYVYRAEVNFVAIKTALVSREKIGTRQRWRLLKRRGESGIDVKLDPGGIRDIEFLVQCLQRVYGGSDRWLRSRGTLFALQKLQQKRHISGKDFQDLTSAYEFLRIVEHRLQLCHGQQLHRLPHAPEDLLWLARSMTYNSRGPQGAETLLAQITACMRSVAAIYERVIFCEQSSSTMPAPEFELQGHAFDGGPRAGETPWPELAKAPALREAIATMGLSQHARRNLGRFLNSAATTSERYGAVMRSPEGVRRALTIFQFSDYLTNLLVQHPADVVALERVALASGGARPLFAPAAAHHVLPASSEPLSSDAVFGYLSLPAVERQEASALLRQHYRRCVLLSGARDLFQARDVFDSLEENTATADAAIQAALAINRAPAGFAALALGRLGSREFDILSDADLLFVRDERSDPVQMQRLAELVMETLADYTREGAVFAVDTRLRPHGREGELVVTPTLLHSYFTREAQPWEALTYLKLRQVAGDRELGNRTLERVRAGIAEVAARPDFTASLANMRTRLEQSENSRTFKKMPGGVYDLDYLAGTLQVRRQLWLAGNLAERLRLVHQHGLLGSSEYDVLQQSARELRTAEHVVRLVIGGSRKWLPVGEHASHSVRVLLSRAFGDNDAFDPELRLAQTAERARSIFLQHF